jgi:hypothetical protein
MRFLKSELLFLFVILLPACTTKKVVNICPKCPELKEFKCPEQPVKFEKIDISNIKCITDNVKFSKNGNLYCLDKENAIKLINNIKVLKECINQYKKLIESYNNAIQVKK